MKLSIIIATFNRATELEELLEDLSTQQKRLRQEEAKEIEVILVDNKSMDNTNEVIYRFVESTSLSIKYFTHEPLGLSHCRNFAISRATGDVYAFLHDNITLDDDWLKESYKIACNCHDEEIGVYGGRVIPMWQEAFPDWLRLDPPYGVKQEVFDGHSHGDKETLYPFESEYGLAEFPSGTNVLIRKEIFENCGDFRTDLGPSAGDGLGIYDDWEFFEYLSTLKIPMKYIPQCIVFHPVHPSQMTMQAIRRWYFKAGKAHYWIVNTDRMKREINPRFAVPAKYRKLVPDFLLDKINGIPLYLYAKLFLCFTWWLLLHFGIDAKRRNHASCMMAETMGQIEAAEMLNNKSCSKKFSFKDRLGSKNLAKPST